VWRDNWTPAQRKAANAASRRFYKLCTKTNPRYAAERKAAYRKAVVAKAEARELDLMEATLATITTHVN
jgi:hypothetical protein